MPKKYPITTEEVKTIIADYTAGKTLRQMEKSSIHCRNYIAKILKENGITIRDNTINSRKYTHNENFFSCIDDEKKAYWLGFIYADGFIESKRENGNQKLGITLNVIDKDHIEIFKEHIQATNPIKVYRGSGYNSNGYFAKILLTSEKTVNDLKELGVLENKTSKLIFPEETKVSKSLLRHFVRGYFDGDGTLYYSYDKYNNRNYQISFIGTKNMMQGINKFFNKDLVILQQRSAWRINFGGNLQVKSFLDKLYNNSSVYLKRKYIKYLDLCKYIER
jgi:hypothetical protein